ncbi:MAG: methyltransferase domain-containing protein [Anaerolineales bacterium]|nr:methyltransferase domain-containing protein [Anaerolineales bacterium]
MAETDPLETTIHTYDQSAALYADNIWEMRLDRLLDAFSSRLEAGARVLDLGCGPGRDTDHLQARSLDAFGLDLSFGMLQEAKKRTPWNFAQGDMHHLPLPNGQLGGVWLSAALLHLPRHTAPQALQEVRRVLKPSGVLFLGVKQGSGESWQDSKLGRRFFIYYQLDEIKALVHAAGFQVVEDWESPGSVGKWLNIVATAI